MNREKSIIGDIFFPHFTLSRPLARDPVLHFKIVAHRRNYFHFRSYMYEDAYMHNII
jgi:hypothetical protein